MLKPDSQWVQGRTYYFSIIVKERNSDSVKYSYYCTVKISGEAIEKDDTIKWTNVGFNLVMSSFDEGYVYFNNSEGVNTQYLARNDGENFREMFEFGL